MPEEIMHGRMCLSSFFVFTARSAPITKRTTNWEREIMYNPKLSCLRSWGGKKIVLPNRIPRRTDRSRLRRSTIVRRFSYHLLYRPRAGIVLSACSRRRNPRLSAWLAQAIAQSALRALPERLALFPCANPLFSLQRTFASFHSLDARAWRARGSLGAAAR